MLKGKCARLIYLSDYLKLTLSFLLIFSVIFSFLFPLKTGETAVTLELSDNDQNLHINGANGGCFGHIGGLAVGDINHDGIDDFIASSLYEDIERSEKTQLPADQDAWTEIDALSLWSIGDNASDPVADNTVHAAGNHSISTTRDASGPVALKLDRNLDLDPATDTLHLQIYVEDSNEQLNKIKIWASSYSNRFEYNYEPNLTLNAGWNQIDLDLSNFFAVGSPDWNNVSKVVITFWGGTAGDIKIDELYFDYNTTTTITRAGAVFLFYGIYGGFTNNLTVDEADVIIQGIDPEDLTGEYITTGDINNDGFDDIIIGTPMDDGPANARENSGAVYVIFGSDSLPVPAAIDLKTDADYIVYGADPGDRFGQGVYTSDINNDQIPDLIIGALSASGYQNDGDWNGEIHIILGSAELSGVLDLSSSGKADISIYGKKNDGLGTQTTIGAGDIYNDGQADLVIGVWGGDRSPETNRFTNEGKVLIINDISNYSGATIDLASFTPDTVILGADSGDRLSRIAIGDVNDDNIDDIIVGADEADGLNNSKENVGEVFVFFGSSSFQHGEIDLKTTDADIRITGADAGDNLGLKIYAGDISNDGIDDILVIAPGGDGKDNAKTDAGDAYAIYGSSNLAKTIDLTATLPELTVQDLTVYGAYSQGDLRDVFGGDISDDGINDLILGFRSGTGAIVAVYDGFERSPSPPSDNNPPSVPQLISPVNGQTGMGTTVEFRWEKSTDPDGDTVTYSLYVCDTTSCITKENIASLKNIDIYYAGTGSGLLLFGIVFAGNARGKRKTALLLAVIMITATFLVSCGSGGGGSGDGDVTPVPANEVAQTVSGLNTGTTYYWKVLVDDGNRGLTESEVRSFTTK